MFALNSLILPFLAVASVVFGNDSASLPQLKEQAPESLTIITVRGENFSNVKVLRVEPDALTIMHATGTATIPFEDLPKDVQDHFNYSPEQAESHRQQHITVQKQEAVRSETQARETSNNLIKNAIPYMNTKPLDLFDHRGKCCHTLDEQTVFLGAKDPNARNSLVVFIQGVMFRASSEGCFDGDELESRYSKTAIRVSSMEREKKTLEKDIERSRERIEVLEVRIEESERTYKTSDDYGGSTTRSTTPVGKYKREIKDHQRSMQAKRASLSDLDKQIEATSLIMDNIEQAIIRIKKFEKR